MQSSLATKERTKEMVSSKEHGVDVPGLWEISHQFEIYWRIVQAKRRAALEPRLAIGNGLQVGNGFRHVIAYIQVSRSK